MDEPWEALDLDDSDISSSLSLRRCNHHSSKPPSPPQPLQQPPSSVCRRPIPGPAGAIQSAMHRIHRPTEVEISTQEYIRRVDEDSGEEFTRNPWVFALNFLGSTADVTPLRAVNKCQNVERIAKVVALVKSSKPNNLGDMMVTLKDPTDVIEASVHRKVLATGEFGKSLAVGSVLILQKVVVFPSPFASCYLNITKSNVVKVITVDCGAQSSPEDCMVATPVIPQTTLGLISKRTEEIARDVQQSYHSQGMSVIQKLMEKEKCSQTTSLFSSKKTDYVANKYCMDSIHADSGCLSESRDGNSSLSSTQPRIEQVDNAEKESQARGFHSAPYMTENLENGHAGEGNGARMCKLLRGNKYASHMDERLNIAGVSSCGTSPRMAENPDGFDSSEANDVYRQRHRDICSSNMAKSVADENICKINGSQKRTQLTNTLSNASMDEKRDNLEAKEENGVKKQRLALISRVSIQDWTDEQLDILDMDED